MFVAAWQFRGADGRRRRELVWLAAAQPGAIVAQAVLGGIVVITKLNPALVSVHFLASVALVAATVALYIRCQEGTGPPRPLVARPVRLAAIGVVGTVALMMTAGTIVTGTGPLAGAADVARYHLPLEGVTQLHADIGWLLAGLMVALLLGLRLTAAPRRAVRLGWLLLALIGLQGVIGYTQYFTGLPAGLVWVHVTGSVAIWITALLMPYSLRDRGVIADTRRLPDKSAPVGYSACPDHRATVPFGHSHRIGQRSQHRLLRQRRRRPRGGSQPRLPDGLVDVRAAGRRPRARVPSDHLGRARLRWHQGDRAVQLLGLGQ